MDDCAQWCAVTGHEAEAVTLWAARSAQAATLAMPELAQDADRRRASLRSATRLLGPRRTEEAERRGETMTLEAAAELAGMLVAAEPHLPHGRAGDVRLTPRERELITLVAQGRTDAQIAEELFISIRTVRSHLDRIRDKTGDRRRADLTRLALRTGLI